MNISLFSLVLVLGFSGSMCEYEPCEDENILVSKNFQSDARKFHLKDKTNNQFLVVEASTMLVRIDSSEQFESSKGHELTWFTACNDFMPSDSKKPVHFDICMAGLEEKRLYYDEVNNVFMFLKPKNTNDKRHFLMKMRLVQNEKTKSFEYASIFMSDITKKNEEEHPIYLQVERNFVKIGSETLLRIHE